MDPFFQLSTFEYHLKGLEKPYTILHISDLHIAAWDEGNTEEEIATAKKQQANWEGGRKYFAKIFGDSTAPEHVVPLDGLLQRFIDLANEMLPDAVVISGDLLESITQSNFRYLHKTMSQFKVPYLWARGNHEMEDREDFAEFMGEHRECQTLQLGKLKLIALNDTEQKVSEEGLDRFKEEAEDGCVPVLVMHIPVMTESNRDFFEGLDSYYNMSASNDPAFMDYLTSAECPVSLYLCGHIHGLYSSEFAPGKTELTATSAMLGGGNIIRLLPD